MAAPFLLKALPVFRLRLLQHHHRCRLAHGFVSRRLLCGAESAVGSTEGDKNTPSLAQIFNSERAPKHPPEWENEGFRTWKDKETEILVDIEPIVYLTKEILHSSRYKDGEPLTPEDEKLVVEKLLAHHPRSQDKIGSGLDSIMVDRHPQFRHSRCLFVVRTDGGWIDFSYQKCLREYIRNKYPSHAEKFIDTHLKRGRS